MEDMCGCLCDREDLNEHNLDNGIDQRGTGGRCVGEQLCYIQLTLAPSAVTLHRGKD